MYVVDVDKIIYDKYEIDAEVFNRIVKDLLPFTPVVSTALAKQKYHAFVKDGAMIVRQEVDESSGTNKENQ